MSGTNEYDSINLVSNMWNWLNSIVMQYKEIVWYDTIQLKTKVLNLANMVPFNCDYISRTG